MQLAALTMVGVSLMRFGLTSRMVIALPLFAASGFFEMIFLTSNQTLLQLSIPDELRGRVTSLVTLNMGLMPLGALYTGIGADFFGPAVVAVVLSAGTIGVAAFTFLFVPTIRDHRMSEWVARGA